MAHICSRDGCHPNNVNGPKANCFICKKICYWACYGVPVEIAVYQQRAVDTSIQIFSSTSNIQLVCMTCLSSAAPAGQMSSNDSQAPNVDKSAIDGIMTEMNKLREQVSSIQSVTNDVNGKLDSIARKTNDIKIDTEAVLKHTDPKQNTENEQLLFRFGTPTPSTRQYRPPLNHGNIRTFTPGVSSQTGTPFKRRRNDSPMHQSQKPKFPSAVVGTNANSSGLVVVAPTQPKERVQKPTFEKAVWVSRLGPTVTEEEVRGYITANTGVASDFAVHKLVKKDRDVSTLNFVSFKIAVSAADFDILNDKNVWPQGVLVRQFVEIKPATLGAFIPTLNGQMGAGAHGTSTNSTPERVANIASGTPPKNS